MKAIILLLLKSVGSDILIMLLESIVKMIQDRDDTTMVKDAVEIKRLAKRNYKKLSGKIHAG